MAHELSPTARALLALEAIQNAPGITAERLGERPGVTERDARRVLRVDRIASAAPLADAFAPPADLDALRVLEEHLSQGWKFPVDVLIDAPPGEVAWWLPRSLGSLSPAGNGSQTRLVASTEDPEWYAGRLAVLPFAFWVTESAPLRDALAEQGRRLIAAAGRSDGESATDLS